MWIGLDIGTTAVKAAAYSPDGRLLATASTDSKVIRVADGGTEQDMDAVWRSAAGVLRDLSAQVTPSEIRSIGICAQGDGLWPVQADGRPAGPAMLWNDTRSARDVIELAESGAASVVALGCNTALWPGTSGVLWRWLARNRPDVCDRTDRVFTCADWIAMKMTGVAATDYSNATIPFLDIASRHYGENQIAALECESIAPKLIPPRRAATILGELTGEASAATGLPTGIPVSVGTLDLSAMIVGMGMDRGGQAMMIIGTTAVVNILRDGVKSSTEPVGATVLHPTSQAEIRVLAPTTGAAAFDWFASLHPGSLGGESAAEIATKINRLVADVPPGSNGVTFLPYLNGERAPFVEPDIRASFNGLSAETTKADLGRAVMEGTGFSLLHCVVEEGGLPDGAIQITGGGSRNAVWCQIIADIVGSPIEVSEFSDQGLWGAACIGAAAAGEGSAIALSRRHDSLHTYDPDETNHQTYRDLFERYVTYSQTSRQAYARLRAAGAER